MLLHQQKEMLHQVGLDPATHPADALARLRAGAAGQTRLALAPFRVQALHHAGLSDLTAAFVNGAVLIRSKETRVGCVAVYCPH